MVASGTTGTNEWSLVTVRRGRDVQQHTLRGQTHQTLEGYNSGEEYIYLLKNTGKTDYLGKNVGEWFYSDYGKPFKALEEDAINDHIAMLKRHLEMMKERKAA